MNEADLDRTQATSPVSVQGKHPEPSLANHRPLWLIGFTSGLLHGMPNVVVVVALAGLVWWGHSSGWALPRFSQLAGMAEKKDDWCAAHGIPESICIECKKELVPQGKLHGWCRTHGVAECVNDNPELAQVKVPTLPKYDLIAAINLIERPSNNSRCQLHERRIQFLNEVAIAKSGVDVDVVQERPMMEYKTANGEIGFDQTYVARLSSRVSGTAWWVPKAVGESVKKGDILALIDAAEVGKAKSEYLHALSFLDQKTKALANVELLIREGVYKEGVTHHIDAKAAVREAESRLLGAQQVLINLGFIIPENLEKLSPREQSTALQFLGLPQTLVQQMSQQATGGNLIPIRAPFGGVVVSREVVAGEVVDATKPLFVIADTSRMWLTLNVRQDEMRYVKLGQKVLFKLTDLPDEVEGRIAWISATVDERTRTVKVRANLPNPEGTLRANAFGTGKIVLREEKNAITVPNEAVQWEGDCFIVFVRDKNYFNKDAPKFFHVRKVRPGAKEEGYTELLAGVLPGEVVATKGSGVLRGELLKNNLGEG